MKSGKPAESHAGHEPHKGAGIRVLIIESSYPKDFYNQKLDGIAAQAIRNRLVMAACSSWGKPNIFATRGKVGSEDFAERRKDEMNALKSALYLPMHLQNRRHFVSPDGKAKCRWCWDTEAHC